MTTEQIREIAYQSAGAASAVFMEAHPQDVMPEDKVKAAVESVLRDLCPEATE